MQRVRQSSAAAVQRVQRVRQTSSHHEHELEHAVDDLRREVPQAREAQQAQLLLQSALEHAVDAMSIKLCHVGGCQIDVV